MEKAVILSEDERVMLANLMVTLQELKDDIKLFDGTFSRTQEFKEQIEDALSYKIDWKL